MPAKIWKYLLKMPESWQAVIATIATDTNQNVTEVLRSAIYEYATRRGYAIEQATLSRGGYNLEIFITRAGWVNEYLVAKRVYGLEDATIATMDITHPPALDAYPLLQRAAAHNNAEFDRQFTRDEDLTPANPAYVVYLDETGANKLLEIKRGMI